MDSLESGIEKLLNLPTSDILDKETLIDIIGNIGLFHDTRHYPGDNKFLYGDDSKYMVPSYDTGKGLYQTPIQFAEYLIYLSQKQVKSYLDIGTLSGWNPTVVAAFLKRFGLEYLHTFDVTAYVSPNLSALWKKYDLPIEYHVGIDSDKQTLATNTYDVIFIDGDHSYHAVKADYETFKNSSRITVFHDINDIWCDGVVKFWNEIKEFTQGSANLYEFKEHPNGYRLMGIGAVEKL